jgi:hypothetical protein
MTFQFHEHLQARDQGQAKFKLHANVPSYSQEREMCEVRKVPVLYRRRIGELISQHHAFSLPMGRVWPSEAWSNPWNADLSGKAMKRRRRLFCLLSSMKHHTTIGLNSQVGPHLPTLRLAESPLRSRDYWSVNLGIHNTTPYTFAYKGRVSLFAHCSSRTSIFSSKRTYHPMF